MAHERRAGGLLRGAETKVQWCLCSFFRARRLCSRTCGRRFGDVRRISRATRGPAEVGYTAQVFRGKVKGKSCYRGSRDGYIAADRRPVEEGVPCGRRRVVAAAAAMPLKVDAAHDYVPLLAQEEYRYQIIAEGHCGWSDRLRLALFMGSRGRVLFLLSKRRRRSSVRVPVARLRRASPRASSSDSPARGVAAIVPRTLQLAAAASPRPVPRTLQLAAAASLRPAPRTL